MSKPAFKPRYRKPYGAGIGRCEETEMLYDLERQRDDGIKAAAKELQRVLKLEHFWQEALPEALLTILEGWDHEAAQLAAQTYLEKQNGRAYNEGKGFLVLHRVDLDFLEEKIEQFDLYLSSEGGKDVPFEVRNAVVCILNLIKQHWPR